MKIWTIMIPLSVSFVGLVALRAAIDEPATATATTVVQPNPRHVAESGHAPRPTRPRVDLPVDDRPLAEQKTIADDRDARQAVALANAFAVDPRDPIWSAQAESSVREAFAESGLQSARLDGVTCGTTLCRFTVAFESVEQRDDHVGTVVGLVRWKARGFADVAPDDPRRYVVYASRDPESFPSVD